VFGFPEGTGALLAPGTRKRLVLSVVGSVLISLLDLLGVLAMLPLMQLIAGAPVDEGALGWVADLLGTTDEGTIVTAIASVIVVAFTVKGVASILFRNWQLRFMADQEVMTSTRILRGYLVAPYAWHLVKNTGDKLWTVEYAVSMGFTGGVGAMLALATEAFTISFIFLGLLITAPLAALLALCYFGLAGLVLQQLIRPRVLEASRRSQEATLVTSSTSLQALGAAKEVKLRRAEEQFIVRYRRARHRGAHARATATLLNELTKYLLEIAFVVGIALLAFVVTRTSGAQAGLVTLGLFVAAGSRILPSTVRLIGALGAIRFSRAPLETLVAEDRSQRAAERAQVERQRTDAVPHGDIEVRDLTVAYGTPPGEPVLRGVDASIRRGESVAIVGSSGAGKSTFVDVLLGLHEPVSGVVTAGGVPVHDNLPAWQARLAVVPQDVYLLDDSLRANIAFDVAPDDDRLADVVRRAQLTDLVAELPDGLDTEVGERGARLSGGQRQRIGIARALYRQPELLVLDEATSALDNETERRLTETIQSLRGTVTMVIVAHRLSTVRHCDQLIFMSHGRVTANGTFEEVQRESAEFAHLVRLGTLDLADPDSETAVLR
jgi:ABC-type multidrug transport system fused ATPase/permease subunit